MDPIPEEEKNRRNTRMRFEQWAQNPKCEANTVSAVFGIPMSKVAEFEGLTPTMGQSPFAIGRGDTFERLLFSNSAERLRPELVAADVIPMGGGFSDLRIRGNGGPIPSLDQSIEETKRLLEWIAKADTQIEKQALPSIIAGPTIRIPKGVMLPEALLIVDVLAVDIRGSRPRIVVGEIKTYPDRGGHTDIKELAVARAQAGIYLHAIDLALSELGLATKIVADRTGFLVLTRPGSNRPCVRAGEDLRYQAERARRGFELLEQAALRLPDYPSGLTEEDKYRIVCEAPAVYGESCMSFCDRASGCFQKALEGGDPNALGEDVGRFLGKMNLNRALELMTGAEPTNPTEQDFLKRLEQVR